MLINKSVIVIAIVAMFSTAVIADTLPYMQGKRPLSITNIKPLPVNRDGDATFSFVTNPISLITSYYDYQIAGYTKTPIKNVPAEYGGGTYFTYHAKRTASGTRRVFFGYINPQGIMDNNAEITSVQNSEGFSTFDIDPLSGKPIFAWHSSIGGV